MKIWARILAVVLAALLACAAFGGCGKKKKTDGTGSAASGESQAEGTSSQTEDDSNVGGTGSAAGTASKGTASKGTASKGSGNGNAAEDDGKTVKLKFWCGYGTQTANVLQKIIDNFNKSQSKYSVTMSNQGGTDELRTKLMSYAQSKLPSLFTGAPLTIAQYAETSYTMPIQGYLDADKDDWEKDMYAQVKASYSDRHGNMIGSPIGLSVTGFGVNVDVLEKTGYNLNNCSSLEAMVKIAKEAVQKGLVKYGFAFNNGQDLHEYLEIEGLDIVNNNDGYSGKPTKSLLNSGETKQAILKFLDLSAQLYKTTGPNGQKGAYPIGAGLGNSIAGDFRAGNILFWRNTNSYFGNAFVYAKVQPKFKWAFLPANGITDGAEYRNQCISEGTGLFIGNTGKKSEMQGAYEFIKFCAKVESQEIWCTNTTYVPFTKAAAASSKITSWQKENFPDGPRVGETINRSSKDLTACYAATGNEMIYAMLELMAAVADNPDSKNFDAYIKSCDQRFQQAIDVYASKTKK